MTRAITLCPSCGALAGDLHAEDCAAAWATTQRSQSTTGRIGTVHLDPDTGEYVMPGDFLGEPELRWKAAEREPEHDSAGAPSDRADSPDVPHCGAGVDTSTPAPALQTRRDFTDDQCPDCRTPPGRPHSPDCPAIFTEPAFSVRSENESGSGPDLDYIVAFEAEHGHKPWVMQNEHIPDSGMLPVNIPLAVQERLFHHELSAAFGDLMAMIERHDWQYGGAWDADTNEHNELVDLALSRLRSGFAQYGSEMFTWDAETRRRNVMEELADAIVYLTSGAVE